MTSPDKGDEALPEAQPPKLGPGDRELAGVLEGERTFVGPEQVVIDLTNRCNNNCIGCWTRSPLLRDMEPTAKWVSEEIPYDSILHLLNDLHDLGTRRVRFTGGGEPLIHPQLDEILKACKQRDLVTCITTNGTRLTEERAELFASLPLDEVAVSIWAATADTYSRTHPNKTSRTFDKIKRNLTLLCERKKLRPVVTIANVVFAMNHAEVEQMYDLALDVGADSLYYAVLDPIEDRTEGLLLTPEHVMEVNAQLDRIQRRNNELPPRRRMDLENWEGFRRRIDSAKEQQKGEYDATIIDSLPCYVGWIFCRILANGDVVPCCRGSDMPMGNINTDGFRKVWQSDKYTEFRVKAKNLSKKDPYFAPIGCHKTCDNLMHNEMVQQRLEELSEEDRQRLQAFIDFQITTK